MAIEMTAVPADPEDSAPIDLSGGPGRRLRQVREARGLTIEQIAAELHLAPQTIDAIEQGRQEGLPAQVFVLGYLRNYARALGLDPEPMIKAYRAAHPETAPTTHRVTKSRGEIGSGHLIIRLISVVVVVTLAVLVGLWWQSNRPILGLTDSPLDAIEETAVVETDARPEPEPAPEPPRFESSAAEEETDPAGGATGMTEESPPSPETAAADPGTTSSQPALREDTAEGPDPSAAPSTPAATGPQAEPVASADEDPAAEPEERGVVELTFDGPCWVDIRDATRDYKLFGEMSKGDRRVLQGTPPYSVIIGNSAAVTITIDGEPFDLARHTRGNVARFTLDPTESP